MATVPDGATATAVWTSNAFALTKLSIGVPGKSSAVIDVTHLANTAAKTKKPGTFEDYGALTLTGQYDPALAIPVGVNDLVTITLPNQDANKTLKVWGFISDEGTSEATVDEQMVTTLTFTVSNLNGSDAETVPVFST